MDLDTLEFFAVKEETLEEKTKEKQEKELRLCQSLRHPHIVSYLGHECTSSELLIFLEYADLGSLEKMLGEFGALAGSALSTAMVGVLEGLDYLHTRPTPVVHRDLKCANVLVFRPFTVKLSDFGNSKCNQLTKSFRTSGSVPWMAPEVIKGEASDEGHGRKADIWSFGCTVIEMITAEMPWGKGAFNNQFHAMHRISSSGETPPVPQDAPSATLSMIRACTRLSQQERPTTTDLLAQLYRHFGMAPIMPRRRPISKPRAVDGVGPL